MEWPEKKSSADDVVAAAAVAVAVGAVVDDDVRLPCERKHWDKAHSLIRDGYDSHHRDSTDTRRLRCHPSSNRIRYEREETWCNRELRPLRMHWR